MLVFRRKIGEEIIIGDDIYLKICGVSDYQVRLGVDAPKDVLIQSEEQYELIRAAKATNCSANPSQAIRTKIVSRLVFLINVDDAICIGDDICVRIIGARDDEDARLEIDAPKDVAVHRMEIYEKIREWESNAIKHANVDDHSASPQPQAANDQVVPADIINTNPATPIAESSKLPIVSEVVAEEDILDLLDETKGNWVSQKKYQNETGYTEKSLRTYREIGKGAVFSKKNPMVGRHIPSGIFFRKVNEKTNSPYEYFLKNAQFSTEDE